MKEITQIKEAMITYLVFSIGNEQFATQVAYVDNIIGVPVITQIPKLPPYLKGVMQLNGIPVPIIDTRIKLGMTETEFNRDTCIIVMEIPFDNEQVKLGIIVDSVNEVIEFPEGQLEPPPNIGSKYQLEFISALCKFNDKFIMILDVEKLFSYDLEEIKELEEENVLVDSN